MTRHRVILAAPADPVFLERVSRHENFAVEDHSKSPDLRDALPGASILVTRSNVTVTRELIDHADRLKLILQGTSGVDNVDLDAARSRGIEVVTIPGMNANAVAESVLGMLITLTRELPRYHADVMSGSWERGQCSRQSEIGARSIGIVGLGRVGSRLASLLSAVGATPSAFDPFVAPARFESFGANRAPTFEQLLRNSDAISFHVPLTDQTRGMLGRNQIAMLRAGTVVINTSRGAVVDFADLIDGLESGHLGGAWVDVFEDEPPELESLPAHPNLILTPHIAGCTREARGAIGEAMFRELLARFP